MITPKILFIMKQRPADYDHESVGPHMTSGLFNSVRFIVDMLTEDGFEAKAVEVVDNNCIHREVVQYTPTHVFIEGLWVVPEKFKMLEELSPNVKWIVRIHSEIPFLAGEGIAIGWLLQYLKYDNVTIAANAPRATRDLRAAAFGYFKHLNREQIAKKLVLLPNSYLPTETHYNEKPVSKDVLNVGCFGAIRPLKNQLIQAVAAIRYADKSKHKLRFHVNGSRSEQGGDNNIKNIRALFDGTHHELVEHPWMLHAEFLEKLASMDVSMCVSFSETFCIVAADSVKVGIPLVASDELSWVASPCQAKATDVESIVNTMARVLEGKNRNRLIASNQKKLREYCINTNKLWKHYLHNS